MRLFNLKREKWLLPLLMGVVSCIEGKSQGKYITYPKYDEYTQIGSCYVGFNNIFILKKEKNGIASYSLCLNNQRDAPYAIGSNIPYDEYQQVAIVLFTDQSHINLQMNFVKERFEGDLSLSQFNMMKNKEIKGIKLLKSNCEYPVEKDRNAIRLDLQLLAKSVNDIKIIYDKKIEEEKIKKNEQDKREQEALEQERRKILDLYLHEHINFPAEARKDGIQRGRVVVQFVVEKDGATSNHKIVRSVHPAIDREVVRVLESMPKWLLGKQHNENVRTYCTISHLVIDK